MAKKRQQSGNLFMGIAPNLLLKQVENTAPYIFQGEIDSHSLNCEYLKKLRFYKKKSYFF